MPANETDIACYTNKPVGQRCATAIDQTVCDFLNNTALSNSLITQGGFDFLAQVGFCAIVADMGSGYMVMDFCPKGCFAADTQIASNVTADGKADYVQAASVAPNSPLVSMADDANLGGDVSLASQTVKRIAVGPEDAQLFVFTLANGHTLRVTQHHPMVLDDGTIIEAREVTKKMSFVGLDGQSVAVTKITRAKPTADVFSFETAGTTQLSHIIVAEGVLVGDLKIQNELESEEASIGLRR
ncbi:MAG TPA: Hint domain-containing protein [Kofleriaceae bacterium]|nr:Hint domain-containing protein [Kofleriaceae bacterium]